MRTTETLACLSANLFPAKLFPCRKFQRMYRAETVNGQGKDSNLRFSGWKDDSSTKAIF